MQQKQIQEKYAVVFGGGGMRGAFEAGVLQAIRELNIPVGLFVGSSIGAINASFAVQEADLASLYRQISLQDIIPNDKLDPAKDIFNIKNLIPALAGCVKSVGYSTDNLRNLIQKFIDIDKIYESDTDLGIVSCSTPFFTPFVRFKEEIPKEMLLDHVLASAGFPIFKRQVIDYKKYIDGGFWNNLPINEAIERGYNKIIAVDLSSVGRIQRIKFEKTTDNLDVIIIKAEKGSLGGLFELNLSQIEENIKGGYSFAKDVLLSQLEEKGM